MFVFLNILALLDPLHFSTHFRFSLSVSRKKPVGSLLGTVFYLQMNQDSMSTLIMALVIHESDILPHLFRSLTSFISVSIFYCKGHTLLLITRYFAFCYHIWNCFLFHFLFLAEIHFSGCDYYERNLRLFAERG